MSISTVGLIGAWYPVSNLSHRLLRHSYSRLPTSRSKCTGQGKKPQATFRWKNATVDAASETICTGTCCDLDLLAQTDYVVSVCVMYFLATSTLYRARGTKSLDPTQRGVCRISKLVRGLPQHKSRNSCRKQLLRQFRFGQQGQGIVVCRPARLGSRLA